MAVAAFGGTAISSLENILRQGVNSANAGVGAAQSGVNAILSGGSDIRGAISDIKGQAGLVNQQGDALSKTVGEVKEQYAKIDPIVSTLLGYGTGLWNAGGDLTRRAGGIFDQGNAILALDPSAGGLAGEFVKYWQQLSPDALVSQAASDTQGAFQNAQGQAERNLSRRGVSASSGAYGALQRQFATALATALAAAKTKARQTGLGLQGAQLDKMTAAANALLGTANTTEGTALQAKSLALNAQKGAGDLIATKGQGLAQAGGLQASAGQMFASAGNLFASAGNLQTNYLGLVNNAYGTLSRAHGVSADAALNAAGIEVRANTGGGGGGGGVRVSKAAEGGGATAPSGAWVDLNHGKANRKFDGADWLWNPNAEA